jgi:hypothetical protein
VTAPKKPTKKGAAAAALVSFVELPGVTITSTEFARQLREQATAMVASDQPRLQRAGRKILQQLDAGFGASLALADAQRRRRSAGGTAGAAVRKSRAAAWHQACIDAAAKQLERKTTARRDLIGKLAAKFGRNPSTVRRMLKKEGVI